jgi:hypothetical protein
MFAARAVQPTGAAGLGVVPGAPRGPQPASDLPLRVRSPTGQRRTSARCHPSGRRLTRAFPDHVPLAARDSHTILLMSGADARIDREWAFHTAAKSLIIGACTW